jgi:hypothetical protein
MPPLAHRAILVLLLVSISAPELTGAQYYFSAMGNDQIGNGTEANPWRSISKFNSLDLNPGDSAFFRANDVFHGSMILDANDTGTDAAGHFIAPITIGSYGGILGSRATISSAATSQALLSTNNGGIELRNLEFENGGSYASNPSSGIQFVIDESAAASAFQHILLENVTSHGFHQSGLSIYAANNIGYQNVRVANSSFFDNQFAGVDVSAGSWNELVHRDLHFDHVTASNNPGFAGCSPHCGHGIVLGQVDGAIVENSVATSNGLTAGKGNVGIWAWQSNSVTIQHNSASDNRSPAGGDGGAFDLDGGVTNSVVQYNVSQNNSGAGYLLAEFGFAEPMMQNVFRYNLSVNDGGDSYGAITIAGDNSVDKASSAVFHNNTVVVDRTSVPSSRGAVWFTNSQHDDISLINNLFVALNGAALIDGATTVVQAVFANNAYWTAGAPVRIGNVTYSSIAQWAAATQQETIDGQFAGIQADPTFGAGSGFRPVWPSPVINAGLSPGSSPWPSWLIDLGPADLSGVPIPQGGRPDIGAAEFFQISGDYNRDGIVDAVDYVIWRNSVGANGVGLSADGNSNGTVDAADYGVWRSHFAQLMASGTAFAAVGRTAAVPEASSQLMLAIATLVCGFGRYRSE